MEMVTDQAMSGLWYILAIVLVASALLARRVPSNGLIRMALLWVAIFAVLLGLFTLAQKADLFPREEGRNATKAMVEERLSAPTPPARTEGQSLRVPIASDGHYWIDGAINGTPARFLIDSGASVTALSEQTARAAALNFGPGQPTVIMVTANGKVEAQRSRIGMLIIGPIRASDLDIVISPAFGDVNVIGMNLLSRLKKWGVENGEMVLTP